jgi:3'-phosphoadenosine 5'-phosphosulfate sulfotransferase (PAPS reductase)/FAD synthetase
MLKKILDAYENNIPKNIHIIFCNTGKEMNETLSFVNQCQIEWNVNIVWLEYDSINDEHGFKITNHNEASRNGEPFNLLLKTLRNRRIAAGKTKKDDPFSVLPNPVARFCTKYLKYDAIRRYMHSIGTKKYDEVLGLRYDEPRRAIRARNASTSNKSKLTPLFTDKKTKEDILLWWQNNNFDLALPVIDGEAPHGNCDLCFLKKKSKIENLIREDVSRAKWWSDQEQEFNNVFRKDRPNYSQLINAINLNKQGKLFTDANDDEDISCFCHD